MSKGAVLLNALSRLQAELNAIELKIALCVWGYIDNSGVECVELSIKDLADATGMSWRTVQKCRNELVRKGVVQLVSEGRERSRFALPAGVILRHEAPETDKPPLQQPSVPVSADEEIAALVADITGGRTDATFRTTPSEWREAKRASVSICTSYGRARSVGYPWHRSFQ